MLWYKAWFETRARFLISLIGITGLCAYRVYDLNHSAPPSAPIDYYYFILRSGQQLLSVTWLIAVTLLLMGGLLQEKANGSAPFTLALPVSRVRLMNERISAGLLQAALLVVVPWTAMYATSYLSGPARSANQALFYVVLLASGGAVFAGASLLISALVEGAYTAPMISAGIVVLSGNAPRSLSFLNPMDFMSGRDYLGAANLAVGPMPWERAAAYIAIAALLIVACGRPWRKDSACRQASSEGWPFYAQAIERAVN